MTALASRAAPRRNAGAAGRSSAGPGPSVVHCRERRPRPAPPRRPPHDEDLDSDPAEPDFTVVDLPTSLRLPRHKLAFRLTHRFARPLGEGDFSSLLADFFGFDGGAQIGLGLRFGLFRGTQLGIYRTSDRTIVLHAQQELLHEGHSPVGLSLVGSIEGLEQLRPHAGEPRLAAAARVLAGGGPRRVAQARRTRCALYAEPSFVANTRVTPSAPGKRGLDRPGLRPRRAVARDACDVARRRVPPAAGRLSRATLARATPARSAPSASSGRVGGHSFQLNFSNALGTTPAQVARGAQGQERLVHRLQPVPEVLLRPLGYPPLMREDVMEETKRRSTGREIHAGRGASGAQRRGDHDHAGVRAVSSYSPSFPGHRRDEQRRHQPGQGRPDFEQPRPLRP